MREYDKILCESEIRYASKVVGNAEVEGVRGGSYYRQTKRQK